MTAKRKIASVGLVAKAGLEAAENLSLEVEQWLRDRGLATGRFLHPTDDVAELLGSEKDLFLVFGGDGTVVSISRRTLGQGVPIAGVNFGRVGFLTELEPENWLAPLAEALKNGLSVEPRMSLRYKLYRAGEALYSGEVVNDVVVTRGKVARLARLDLGVNNKDFVSLRSDGLILSTPTGASGYAGSAGGPLLLPSVNAYIVAAICPYLSSFPPMVLSSETLFSVKVTEASPDLYLTMDGQEAYALVEGDQLEVWGEPERFFMADFGQKDYFERLRRVGFVQESKTR